LTAGFSFEGLYLPWALIAFTVLIGGSPMMDFLGVVAGHLYYFLLEVLPTTKGWTLLQTPAILYVPLPSIDACRSTELLTRSIPALL
jgi:Derlin-2/3